MQIQIRKGVFETNSSSTHTLVIANNEEYEKWQKGELYFDAFNEKFYTEDELFEMAKNDKHYSGVMSLEAFLEYYDDICSYKNYGSWYENYEYYHTTQSGDKIVVFGYYGYDG